MFGFKGLDIIFADLTRILATTFNTSGCMYFKCCKF
ncbi:hypothetical protein Zm00014a_026430 [Zea mays]|uniref:Uncharacterized protein n=1 Tax=Zea mays TaxID=4577 RepID=A0A3L6FFB5_MAIZE|nr:hypothetical protein Zm00014a_026430 [Zea mays]